MRPFIKPKLIGYSVRACSGHDGAGGVGPASGSDLFSDLRPTRRRSLHRAAADAISGDAALLHRVAAASSVDEHLAEALEVAAMGGVPGRPAGPGPAQLMEWASDLSADHAGRERRLLMAAVYRVCAGSAGAADLWVRVEACAPSALRSYALAGRALLADDRLDAEFHLARGRMHADGQRDAVAIACGMESELCAAAAMGRQTVASATAGLAAVRDDRVVERWLTRLLAAGRCYTAGPLAAVDALLGIGPAAGQIPPRGEPQDCAAMLTAGCYRVLSGQPLEALGDLLPLVTAADQVLAPELACRASQWLALAYHLLGVWRHADDYAAMAIDAAVRPDVCGKGAPHALAAQLAAHRGDWDAANEHMRNARYRGASQCPDDAVLYDIAELTIAQARGVLLADHPALARLAQARDAATKYRVLWLPLRAEALVESGSEAQAAAMLADLTTLAEQVPYLRLAWCRLSGRLAERRRDPIAARRHYEDAASLPQECLAMPFQLGLLEHCHGRLLCGLGATAEGTVMLDRAGTRLIEAGAISFGRRCAADLAARRHAVDGATAPSVLTERERVVARLVTAGLTNQEVATRLYVSVKTVEYHLAQIYGKLGIRSRRQLARYGHVSAALARPRPRSAEPQC
ncbi:MAG TPA: LuxR C-terminal-related transcriptional regulator [Streptosporangiaceae bacterium]|nr:LuxR C-terminal-related transcriptional regulator [Streptosporangiaceae bacterium]